MGSYLLLSCMFHFSSSVDASQHEKDIQESTEGHQGENMSDESLGNGSVGNERETETQREREREREREQVGCVEGHRKKHFQGLVYIPHIQTMCLKSMENL